MSLSGVLYHVGVLVVTIPYIVVINAAIVMLILDYIIFGPKNRDPSALRKLFHLISTLVFANWSLCVGRLLVWIYGLRCHASIIVPNSKSTRITTAAAATSTTASSLEAVARFLSSPPAGKVNVLVMNHRTVLDWMFFWALIAECPGSDLQYALKIVPKAVLSKLPLFGWAMQCFRFLFLSRQSTESDCAMIASAARTYCAEPNSPDHGVSVLIFPEGTDLSKVHLEKSHDFCRKNSLPLWDFVLAPRALGLGTMLQAIGKENLGEVLDITLGYEDYVMGERPSESSCIMGRAPRAMHVALRRYRCGAPADETNNNSGEYFQLPDAIFSEPLDQSTVADTKLSEFVRQVFAEKELILKHFYERQKQSDTTATSGAAAPCDPSTAQVACPPGLVAKGWGWSTPVRLSVALNSLSFVGRIALPFGAVVSAWFWAVFVATWTQLQLSCLFAAVPFMVCRYLIFKKPIHEALLQ